jgi:glutamate mutase epsilon subunit
MTFSNKSKRDYLNTSCVRLSALFFDVLKEMESDLKRMRERKLSQEFIDSKDLQIETLVNYYNSVDDLTQFMKLEILNLQMENHFLTQLVAQKVTVDELIRYKPTTRTVIEKVEATNEPQVLTSTGA